MRELILFFVAFYLLGLGCNQTSGNREEINGNLVQNPATLTGDTTGKKFPVMSFETMEHDFGKMIEGDKVIYNFQFTNNGKAPLLISNVKASCGCTTPEWPKNIIQPGESSSIKVQYDSKGRPGEFSKGVVVTANTYPNNTTLKILGVVFKE
ncbi:MAG: DUF1573 domain-containing protein [Chitinophagales bacterium]|nr:DUF1573 domain-containing protein [Chitinophagales bacterium]